LLIFFIDHTNGDDYAGPLLGILIMQDVHLGFLIAILPALAGHHGTRSARVIKSGLVHDLLHGIRHSGIYCALYRILTVQETSLPVLITCILINNKYIKLFMSFRGDTTSQLADL
jgi:hypothetical protein